MPPSQPPSIFANHAATNPPRTSSTGTPAPVTPLERPRRLLQTPPATWTPALRLDLSDPISPPLLFARSGGTGGGSSSSSSKAAPQTPPAIAGKKRPAPRVLEYNPAPASEPLHKRRRVHTRARHSLDSGHFSVSKSAHAHFPVGGRQPPSPLFFSACSPRPHLPARFSSSEAAARMLSKAHGDEGGIKTVTLARGTFNGLSPPGPTSIASGRSSDRSSLPPAASPEARDRTDPLRLLGSVGIVELLEQETRPTFILDIGDSVNYSPRFSALKILFANTALRSSASTWALVAGRCSEHEEHDATALTATQFRNWLLSPIQGDTPVANPSPVKHGGVIWSSYTLRKRLRVVSGAVPTHATASITPASDAPDFPVPSTSSTDLPSGNSIIVSSASAQQKEPQDYFGSTSPSVASLREHTPPTAARRAQNSSAVVSPRDVSGIFQRSADITLPSAENSASFNNECVLRAQRAGGVDAFHSDPNSSQDHDMGFFDWTRLPLSASLPRHIQFARSIDWPSTPLGPIEYWSNDLRAMCNLIMWVFSRISCSHYAYLTFSQGESSSSGHVLGRRTRCNLQ